ncbi:cytochrome P450 [Streptomyces viridochromogenes]|uniref:Putative cytochrome n=1 Tax=Streptomyces viridochromogenes Tue57 TaxID=1160705 RepID=L8PBE3_STRVR|nr:cytochrome P450 [Streptomyces viridochromogenes]ELS53700.1 putative cytochrome [Streptomyces viridochromogenes Tue57]
MTMTTSAPQAPIVTASPLFGSMGDLLNDPLGAYLRARRDHGDVVRFRAGPPGLRSDIYAVFSAEGAQQVLATRAADFRKDNVFYEELRQSVGNGLLTSQDEVYLRQRRLVQPLFTRRRVNGYASQVAGEAAALAAVWREAPGGSVELVGEMHRFALRVVGRILFGTDVEKAFEVIERTMPPLQEYSLKRGFSPLKAPRTWPTPANRRAGRLQAELYGLCDGIIESRRGREDGDDLVTLLVHAENAEDGSLDADELREQVLIFLLAGHETTATALAFALHLLARHPQEQRRVRDEVDRVLGGPGGRAPTAADMEALPCLTRVLKEAMRLYPSAPVIGRRSVADAEIEGVRIPAGADVLVSPWVTQRHPDYWPDPERFDPSRFTPEAEAGRPRYAWFPFGGGPRACIGQHLSMLESVLGLAVLLREFEFEDAEPGEVPLGAGITLMAKGPARARIAARG